MAEYEFKRPMVTVDVALFTALDVATEGPGSRKSGDVLDVRKGTEKRLHVALVPRSYEPDKGRLALPGSSVHVDVGEDTDLEATAARVLREQCGLTDLFLDQLKTYGNARRDPRDWSVTVAYYALVPADVLLESGADMKLVQTSGLKGLPFDHDTIVREGVERVRGKSTYTTLPMELLPSTFTFKDLEGVYEALLGRPVHTADFRRKMAALKVEEGGEIVPFLRDTKTTTIGGRHRRATLYEKAIQQVIGFPQRF